MLNIIEAKELSGVDVTDEVTVIHQSTYVLVCKDQGDNILEFETSKETYIQVNEFLDKLRSV